MKIMYICNCKKECSSSCWCVTNGGPCNHTADIEYSKNYTEVPLVREDSHFVDISNEFDSAKFWEEEENGKN